MRQKGKTATRAGEESMTATAELVHCTSVTSLPDTHAVVPPLSVVAYYPPRISMVQFPSLNLPRSSMVHLPKPESPTHTLVKNYSGLHYILSFSVQNTSSPTAGFLQYSSSSDAPPYLFTRNFLLIFTHKPFHSGRDKMVIDSSSGKTR